MEPKVKKQVLGTKSFPLMDMATYTGLLMEQIRFSQEGKSYEELQLQYSEMVIQLQHRPNYFISILICLKKTDSDRNKACHSWIRSLEAAPFRYDQTNIYI
jgi:hypothetical protein